MMCTTLISVVHLPFFFSRATMARHAYLGELEDVARPHAAHFASGAIIELPLMFLRDIVLFPGEELPLRVLSDTNLEAIRHRLANEASMLAVLCPGQGEPVYGTTVRVERTGLTDTSATLTGAAKQRFRLRSLKSIPGGRGIYGTVEILADVTPSPLPFPMQWKYAPVDNASRRRRVRPRLPSYWGYEQYALFDALHLVDRIQQIMVSSAHCNWFRKLVSQEPSKESLVKYLTGPSEQQDPVRFGFWIAANLPVSHAARIELLKTECIVRLLRREISMLEQLHENIYCSHCRTLLAHTKDIFSMSNDSTFVNPGGFVHQIMTLRDVRTASLLIDGPPSTQDSWFSGYAWSIVYCGVCGNHLGWQFDGVETPDMSPLRFFGFRRTALTQSRAMAPVETRAPSSDEDNVHEHHSESDGDSEEEREDHESSSDAGRSSEDGVELD